MEAKERHPFLRPYRLAVVMLGAAAVLFSGYRLPVATLDFRFILLLIMTTFLGSRLIVRIPRVKGEITVSDTFIFLTMLLYGGEVAILLATLDALYSSARFSKVPITIIFNAAMIATATFATVWVLRFCFGSIVDVTRGEYSPNFVLMVAVMAFVQYGFNAWLAAVHSAFKTNQSIWYTWSNGFLWTSITYFAGASSAAIIAKVFGGVGIYAFIVVTPIIAVVYFTYRTYLKSVEVSQTQTELAHRHIEELSHHISEQERISRALKESEEHFRNAFDHAAGMALVAPDGRWLQVNQSLCDMLGYSAEEFLATCFHDQTHPDDLGGELVQIHQLLGGKISTYQLEKRFIHKLGHKVWVLASASVVNDAESCPQHLIFQIQDITDRKLAEAHIHHAAFHDALTGLPNRIRLTDHLSLAVERAKRHHEYQFAVLFIDLDRFKLVNDSLGHPCGDQLLVELSKRLNECVRGVDTVARLGGDEFAILLDGIEEPENATHIAARIQEALEVPFNLDGHEVFTTASIGIAFSLTGYDKPEDILRDSDTAMYRAKSNGKARFEIFDRHMHTRAVELLKLENDLRRAVERNEIEVYYQSVVMLDTEQIIGFEALARWRHPEQGIIAPASFIPLAEETGLIIPLGMSVLRQACEQTYLWHQQFPNETPLSISVNISSKQFSQPDLVERIEQILTETKLAAGYLRLELTESVVMENAEVATTMLVRLNQLGVKLSLDDFGTGYSSLSYLHRFSFDTLKIDYSFVSRMTGDSESAKIVKTIMTLAAELGISVTAEGVETAQQRAMLRDLHCMYAQGYLFSRPVPAITAGALLSGHSIPTNPVEASDHEISPDQVSTVAVDYSM
jgi:diguanylate cyclase (GGDEF)-like protein/PAS domain S-box-containing protein